jgi:hypothetical protein
VVEDVGPRPELHPRWGEAWDTAGATTPYSPEFAKAHPDLHKIVWDSTHKANAHGKAENLAEFNLLLAKANSRKARAGVAAGTAAAGIGLGMYALNRHLSRKK